MVLDMPLFEATDQQYSVGRYWDLETRKLLDRRYATVIGPCWAKIRMRNASSGFYKPESERAVAWSTAALAIEKP